MFIRLRTLLHLRMRPRRRPARGVELPAWRSRVGHFSKATNSEVQMGTSDHPIIEAVEDALVEVRLRHSAFVMPPGLGTARARSRRSRCFVGSAPSWSRQ
jgi:hypothetical protein